MYMQTRANPLTVFMTGVGALVPAGVVGVLAVALAIARVVVVALNVRVQGEK